MANEGLKIQVLSFVGDALHCDYQKIGKRIVIPDVFALPHQGYFLKHGVKQRIGDFESGDKLGQDKFDTVTRYLAHLKAGGDWNMSGERDTTAVVIEAVNRLNPKLTVKKLAEYADAHPEDVKVWRAKAPVKAEIAKIYAERAAKAAEESDEELDIEIE